MHVKPSRQPDPDAAPRGMEDSLGRTFGIKKELQGDIIHFLAARYTRGAVLSLGEVMRLYRCAEPRARRVLKALEEDRMLVPLGGDSYRVSV